MVTINVYIFSLCFDDFPFDMHMKKTTVHTSSLYWQMSSLDPTFSEFHTPVLFREVIDFLPIFSERANVVVDATLGLWGHASGIIPRLHTGDTFIGIDRDSENLAKARGFLTQNGLPHGVTVHWVHANFSEIEKILTRLSLTSITACLYDLWVSSVHFDDGERGISIRSSGLLDMRFDRRTGVPASRILETYSPRDLEMLFRKYGEEPKAFFIAQAIEEARKKHIPLDTTDALVSLIRSASHDPKSPLRVFQALRIEVNVEFGNRERLRYIVLNRIESWGRVEVITFHSLEDRLVKNIFTHYETDIQNPLTWHIEKKAPFKKITKKPITPTDTEIQMNPRSRSAKLRVTEKQ